jgi:hypothetical protein
VGEKGRKGDRRIFGPAKLVSLICAISQRYDVQNGFFAQNNGKVAYTVDNVTGETVGHSYDTLNRLNSAGNSAWWENFTYDGSGRRGSAAHC